MSKNDDLAEKMVNNLAKALNKQCIAEQRKYFELLEKINDLNKYSSIFQKNVFDVSIDDQTKVYQLMVKMLEQEKEICEKYNFISDKEDKES